MALVYNLDPFLGYKGANITLDLATFFLSKEDISHALNLSENQWRYINMTSLPDVIEDAVVSLYYPFGCVRVKDHVVTTGQGIIQKNLPWWSIQMAEEDSLVHLRKCPTGLNDVVASRPRGTVITLTHRYQDPISKSMEFIQLHIEPRLRRHILQYKYEGNNAFSLLRRLERLSSYSDSDILVGNTKLRTILFS